MLAYRSTSTARLALTIASLTLLACGGAEPTGDGGSRPPDGGSLRDAAVHDASFDAGAVRDAAMRDAATRDAGAVHEAGAMDASTSDAAAEGIACTAGDAGPPPAWDAGPDPAGYCRDRALRWSTDCDPGRLCLWGVIADLCESERVELLAQGVSCLERYGSSCPTFSDPGLSDAIRCVLFSNLALDRTGGRARCLADRIVAACGEGTDDYYNEGVIPMPALSDATLDELDRCMGEAPTCAEARACYLALFPGLAACDP